MKLSISHPFEPVWTFLSHAIHPSQSPPSSIGTRVQSRSQNSRCRQSALAIRGLTRAILDGVAARKRVDIPIDRLLSLSGDGLALPDLVITAQQEGLEGFAGLEASAVLVEAGWVRDGLGQELMVPAVQEVTMVGVAGGITGHC